ncbi:hypothetical protein ACSBR2_031475 [Camellia fascicularis]
MDSSIITEVPTLPFLNHQTFIINFNGARIATTVTSTPSVVRKWLRTTLCHRRRILHHLVVGLGVQWLPGYRTNPAATLQLCVGRRCLIFQLLHSDSVPNLLRRFLLNPRNTFVGLWNHSDADKLLNSKHALGMFREPLDLRQHAFSKVNGRSLEQASRETIVEEYLGYRGVRFDDQIGRSEWDNKDLSSMQVLQACVDSYISFLIGKDLKAWEIS